MADLRVLIVDDQDLVRAGFSVILQSEPGITVVGEARNGEEAVARVLELRPDVVCMDVQMPVMDGLEAARRIAARAPGTGVLILTTFDRDDYLFDALTAGASGFLLKNSTPEKLIEAVQIIGRGDALLAPDVTRRVIERCAGRSTIPPTASPELDDLSGREREVLGLLARGMSNSEIALALYVGEATVKSHVSKVLQKLGLRDRVHAVVFAYENGVVART
ncbi:response regulator transcription factor [Glaciihabitans sp. INWT7]|uniref:response regulator n=1 Tax=Glaciihabitans sp. INWT7 TaxID=2596912 RepID=UPI001628DBC9|nr:response regulator transcription factor [Glaciihabitans sp. INWT7]QNE48146.1 response regulator transcription factor [Glaciihabitans sp. INWT7]